METGIMNENYAKMPGNYLFSQIAAKVKEYGLKNPGANVIKLGIGDVTRPVIPAVTKALEKAIGEMACEDTFMGYGPENGYGFLREAISENDYRLRKIKISPDEIYVSDGSKCDCANIGELFSSKAKIALCDPVYPVYVDSNAMSGRAGDFDKNTGRWSDILYMECTEEKGFLPSLPPDGQEAPDVIYLCFPNNPTGSTIGFNELEKWIDYANENNCIILYDGAYEAFITQELPRSIFEIQGAKTCAIEFRSFSKTAGFTGLRCAYTVIPKELERDGMNIGEMWARRQSTKFNGVSYITQRAAEAVYTEEGQRQVTENIDYYMENARLIYEGLKDSGLKTYGGINAPYIWMKTPEGLTSWEFFDLLLEKAQVVGTPGVGFGPCGEGFFRFSAFGNREKTITAIERIKGHF